ncbi:MAG: DUF3179 domain-containing protein [Nitrososphaerales archaeon]
MKLWMIAPISVAAVVTLVLLMTFPIQLDKSTVTASNEDNNSGPLVPLEKIVSGGPPKDGIPSIDKPKFVSVEEATFMQDGDIVIGLQHNGITKAYPLKILVWHEIVNDEIGGLPVAVTYCPLCFTNMVFERTIDGNVVEFGTSGKLYNSNLVMYDRLSDSLWSQAMAKGIAGKYSGDELKRVPFDLVYWKEWKQLYPNALVLSTDTGSTRPYGVDPYGDYYTTPEIYFPVEHRDDRLGPKELVMGLEDNNNYKAYKLNDIENKKVINDSVGEKKVLLVSLYPFMTRSYDRTLDGNVLEFQLNNNKLIDKQTGSEWNFEGQAISGSLQGKQLTRLALDPGFWFSWAAFHPDTELYKTN